MKYILRHILVAVIAIASTLSVDAQVVKGEKSFGPRVGYVSKNESASAGLFFQYAFSEHVRVAPEIGYIFRHNNLDAFTFDLNAHFPFGFTGERVAFYPLAGVNYSSWNSHFAADDIEDIDDVSTRVNRFGLNLGAGFELRCNESMKLSLEAKYGLVKGYTSAYVSAGISFVF